MTTAILTHPRYAAHTQARHVERAERLRAIEQALDASGLRRLLTAIEPSAAEHQHLAALHRPAYLQGLRLACERGGGHFDADTYYTHDSWDAATLAAGAAIRAVQAVAQHEVDNAFALVRPPGHHATPGRPMGFCLINNIAVAARYALDHLGYDRVAIVDYDVHHGNGTQEAFEQEPRLLFCSTHGSPLYPGTGMANEMGYAEGVGTTLNIPLPYGCGERSYTHIFDALIIPALRRWKPQLILVSAGFDAHWADPIGPMALSVTGFAKLTRMLYDLAGEVCAGRLVLILEGGYNLEALGASVVAAFHVLLGHETIPDLLGGSPEQEPDVSRPIDFLQKNHPLFQ